MNIVITTEAYYDWEVHPNPESITEADQIGSMVKLGHDGKWLRKVEINKPTHITIGLPESEIQDCMAHFARKNEFWPRTREQVACWYLASKTLPHHGHPQHFTDIVVHEEPKTEKALKEFFQVKE